MATQVESIQQLYIAYFNRPADAGGLAFWLDSLSKGGTLASISKQFAAQAEYKVTYAGKSADATINQIYQNLFNRSPDVKGLDFWSKGLQNGTYTIDNIVELVAASAQQDPAKGPDTIAIQSKVAAAVGFTDYLNTDVNARIAYATGASNQIAKDYIHSVVDAATLAAATTSLPTVVGDIIGGSAGVGTTFNLGVSVDAPVGTAANDTFNALSINPVTGLAADTLGAFDTIDGGAGNDTFNIYSTATVNLVQQGTVKNVETINIYNSGTTAATQFGGVAGVNAGAFEGATAVWQIGNANKVTGLATTTTAGFRAIAPGAAGAALAVTAAGASAQIALDKIVGSNLDNSSDLAVDGTKLTSVTITGTLADNAVNAAATADAAAVDLTATIAKDATTFTLNTAVKTNLDIVDTASTVKVSTLAAGSSTGGIKFVGDADVSSITTGSGADTVTLATALNATVKTATVNTGAGKDNITVTATGVAAAGHAVIVDAGAGDDKIAVTFDANVAYTIAGGAGNDTVTVTAGTIKTTDIIDGGEGSDTIALAGQLAYVSDDYLVYTKVLKNFEGIKFTTAAGGTTAFDASQVAGFKNFAFDAGGAITKVAADQIVTTKGTLAITAKDYAPAAEGDAASTTVYGNALTAVVNDAATVTAKGLSAALTVNAKSDLVAGSVAAVLTGDVKTATVALAHGVNTDDSFSVASISVTTATTVDAGGTSDAYVALGGLTSLTVTGNGTANVVNATKLVTVDASGLNSVDAAGKATTGLVYTSTNTSAETIKLGNGIDAVTLNSSTYGGIGATKMDTVTGLHFVLNAAGTALDASSDTLDINAPTALTVAKYVTTQTDFDLALKDAAAANNADAAHNTLVFAFGGDTYVFIDGGSTAGLIDATDTIVKLTGAVNLDTLVIALS